MTHSYSINLSEEVLKGMTEKARHGGFQTSPALGYAMNENNRVSIVEDEAEYIRYIFNQYVHAGKSPYQIAKNLNRIGIKSKRGNPMDARGVAYILQNPIYIGKVRWTPTGKAKRNVHNPDTIIAMGTHDAIISNELFEAAIKRFQTAAHRTKLRNRPPNECKHWLSGLVKCSVCGSGLVLAASQNSPAFQCGGYTHGKCLISHSISVNKLEKAVIYDLKQAVYDSPEIEYAKNADTSDCNVLYLLDRQLAKIDERIQRATEAYLHEIDTIEEYQKNKQMLNLQKQRLLTEIELHQKNNSANIENDNSLKIKTLTQLLSCSCCNVEAKQKAIRSIVSRIIYNKQNKSIEIYYNSYPSIE